MKITENNFVEQLRKHNEKALIYVIRQYGDTLYSIVCRHLRLLRDYREECMNDILLAIWKNAKDFNPELSSFQNWACGIARYKAIDYLRKYYRRIPCEDIDDMDIPADDQALQKLVEEEISEELGQMLSCLNEEDREIFIKLYMEEKEMDEISRETGLSKEVIYNRISRGKKRIRETSERKEM